MDYLEPRPALYIERRSRRRSKLEHIRFYDLRRIYASLLIAQGAHPKYTRVQVGHASIETTLDRHGHLMPDNHEAETRKLGRVALESGDRSSTNPGHVRPDPRR